MKTTFQPEFGPRKSARFISVNPSKFTINIRTDQNLVSLRFESKKDMDEACRYWVNGGDLMDFGDFKERPLRSSKNIKLAPKIEAVRNDRRSHKQTNRKVLPMKLRDIDFRKVQMVIFEPRSVKVLQPGQKPIKFAFRDELELDDQVALWLEGSKQRRFEWDRDGTAAPGKSRCNDAAGTSGIKN